MAVLPFIGAGLGAANSIIGARQHNRAIQEAARAEANMLATKQLDDRQFRAEQFGQLESLINKFQGGAGGPAGSGALNFGELLTSAAGDARTDISIIDREYRYRMLSLSNEVKSQSKDVLFEGFMGALQGFQIGSSLSSSFSTLFPAKAAAESLPEAVETVSGLPDFGGFA
jgi:hypothetical protein